MEPNGRKTSENCDHYFNDNKVVSHSTFMGFMYFIYQYNMLHFR